MAEEYGSKGIVQQKILFKPKEPRISIFVAYLISYIWFRSLFLGKDVLRLLQ